MLWGEENAEQHILCDYPQEMRERSRTWSCQQFLTFLLPEIKTKKKMSNWHEYFQNPDSQTLPQIDRIIISREWGPEICSSYKSLTSDSDKLPRLRPQP